MFYDRKRRKEIYYDTLGFDLVAVIIPKIKSQTKYLSRQNEIVRSLKDYLALISVFSVLFETKYLK